MPFVLLPPLNLDDTDPYPGGLEASEGASFNPESIISAHGDPSATDVDTASPRKVDESSSAGITGQYPHDRNICVSEAGGAITSSLCDTSSKGVGESDKNEERTLVTSPKSRIPFTFTTAPGERGTSSSSHSTSSPGTGATIQHYQPQIHHHHLAASPATTPVRVPSAEHLF